MLIEYHGDSGTRLSRISRITSNSKSPLMVSSKQCNMQMVHLARLMPSKYLTDPRNSPLSSTVRFQRWLCLLPKKVHLPIVHVPKKSKVTNALCIMTSNR